MTSLFHEALSLCRQSRHHQCRAAPQVGRSEGGSVAVSYTHLRKENAELTVRCEELRSELDKISTAPLQLDVPSTQPAVPFPETAAQTPPAAGRQSKTKLEHLGDEVLAELAKLMPCLLYTSLIAV